MQASKGRRNRINIHLVTGTAFLLATLGGGIAIAAPVQGQGNQKIKVDIERGDLAKSLTQLGRQAQVQIAFLPDRVRGRRARALRGSYTVEQALEELLAGTGLRYQRTPQGTYVVGGPTAEAMEQVRDAIQDINAAEGRSEGGKAAVPEILVVGQRNWSLNLDIPRTRDDAQPYVVYTQEDLKRSGATSLEDFFRNFLGADNAGVSSTHAGNHGQSYVDLRGLGADGTLILVDGRRVSQANTGDGIFTQSSVNGIPMEAIERIEVLASSASGIYGSNAVGGVINIIRRRDFRGIEATAYYGDTSRLDASDRRLTLNGSFPLEKGRTQVSFTGTWQRTGALYANERDYVARGRALLEANGAGFATGLDPVTGALPNIASRNNSNLVLKPQYGGASLGSRFTYVPAGYRGLAQDGVAALVANAGSQDLNLAPIPDSGLAGILFASKSYDASFTVRREFNKWLNLYGEFGIRRYEYSAPVNQEARIYVLPAASPNNPFTTDVSVSLPITTANRMVDRGGTTKRALLGGIVKLPLDWQAAIDLSWNWTSYDEDDLPPGFDLATAQALANGAIPLLRDLSLDPISFGYLDKPLGGLLTPSRSFTRSYAVKLAGPTPLLRLWGGKPILTLLFQQNKETMGEYVSYINQASNSAVNFTPERSQKTESVYGEVRLPILGKDNHVPLIEELELQIAGRYDRYTGIGAQVALNCFPGDGSGTYNGPLPESAYTVDCPVKGSQPVFATARNHSTNPTVALRWAPSRDIVFRGSYSTGYLPPRLNDVVSFDAGISGTILAGKTLVNARDPLRGNEAIGESFLGLFRLLPARTGGNPDIDPQTSTSWSFGTVLTPRFLPALRFSADWTRITQRNVYFQPFTLIGNANSPSAQQAFNDFLAAYPERFTRSTDPSTFGPYGVGPIIFANLITANMSYVRTEAVDFDASYFKDIGSGRLTVQANATWLRSLKQQTTPSALVQEAAGVIGSGYFGLRGGLRWKGNATVSYSTDRWTLGVRGRYMAPYWLNPDHIVDPFQGAAKIESQIYFDMFGSFRINQKTEFRAGVNNIFDRSPPIIASSATFYSVFGDPRRANFNISLKRKF